MLTYVKRQQRRWSRSARSLTLILDAMVMDILKIILKVT
jgi:hypothetical protein